MKSISHPEIAEALLKRGMEEDRKGYVSTGNAVTSIKALTLCLRAEWYKRQQREAGERVEEELDLTSRLRISLGTALGRFVNPVAEVRHELETPCGVVSGRTDLVEFDQGEALPAELKVTWGRSSYAVSHQYVEQLAGYAVTMGVTKGRLYIAYVAGEWGFKIKPEFRCIEYSWTPDELHGWYEELVRRTGAVVGGVVPSYADHYSWECKTCAFNKANGGQCDAEDGKTEGWFMEEETV